MRSLLTLLLVLLSATPAAAQQIRTEKQNRFVKAMEIVMVPVVHHPDGRVDPLATAIQIGMVGSNAADYATTRIALSRGAREANPIMAPLFGHEPAALIMKGVMIPAIMNLSMKGFRATPGKGAKIARYVIAGVSIGLCSWAAQNNIRVARRLGSRGIHNSANPPF
jgi:hypothetical protein